MRLQEQQIDSPRLDTGDFMIEHYADSDLNCDAKISVRSLREEGCSIWGPEVPDTFMM
jgi:hypothetical protein